MGLPGGKRRKETLHSKASASAAHVAGFGLHLEGFGPPNLLEGFFDSLRHFRWNAVFLLCASYSIKPKLHPRTLCKALHRLTLCLFFLLYFLSKNDLSAPFSFKNRQIPL